MTFRRLASAFTILAGLSGLAQPAAALTFNFTTKPGDTLSTEQRAAFQAAADIWSATLSDAITVNLAIGFTSLGANVLGQTTPSVFSVPKNAVQTLLGFDATSQTDIQAVSSLYSSTQSQLVLTSAELKAIGGFSSATSDGAIEFSNSFSFSTSRNGDGSIAAGTYDLIGIAAHEIGHLLGFVSSIDGGNVQTLLDQFRYGASGVRSVVSGAAAYFSIDNGATNLAGFSDGVSDQASHWALGTNAVMMPEVGAGQVQNVTALDLLALDALGYDVVAVPEPWSIGLLTTGIVFAAGTRRRRA